MLITTEFRPEWDQGDRGKESGKYCHVHHMENILQRSAIISSEAGQVNCVSEQRKLLVRRN